MNPIQVFIVEDDPMVASINKRFTEKISPFTVIGTSHSEEDALRQIQQNVPDLVLLDIYLTQGSGLNLLQKIRSLNLPIDVILVTAARDTATIYQTLRYGALDYLIKPFEMERLQQALQNYMKLRQLMSRNSNLSQDELDKLNAPSKEDEGFPLPKGVHLLTLEQIISYLLKQVTPLSCQQIASALTMSKITAWRYLEYLTEQGQVQVELEYGTVGRPTKLYRVKEV